MRIVLYGLVALGLVHPDRGTGMMSIPIELLVSGAAGSMQGAQLLRSYGPTLVPRFRRGEHGELTPAMATVVVVALLIAALVWGLVEHDGSILKTLVPSVMAWVVGGVITQTVATRRKRESDKRESDKKRDWDREKSRIMRDKG